MDAIWAQFGRNLDAIWTQFGCDLGRVALQKRSSNGKQKQQSSESGIRESKPCHALGPPRSILEQERAPLVRLVLPLLHPHCLISNLLILNLLIVPNMSDTEVTIAKHAVAPAAATKDSDLGFSPGFVPSFLQKSLAVRAELWYR